MNRSTERPDPISLQPTLMAPEGFHAGGLFPLVLGFQVDMPENLTDTKGFWVVLDSADGAVEFEDGKRVAHFRLNDGNGRVMARLTCLTPRAVLRSAFFIDGCHSGIVSFEFDLEHTGSWAHPMTVPLRTGH